MDSICWIDNEKVRCAEEWKLQDVSRLLHYGRMKEMLRVEYLSLVKTLQLNFTCVLQLQKGKGKCKSNNWLFLFTRHHNYTRLFIENGVDNKLLSAFLADMKRSVSLMPV